MLDIKSLSPQKSTQKTSANAVKKMSKGKGVSFSAVEGDVDTGASSATEALQGMHAITIDHLIFHQNYPGGGTKQHIQYGHDMLKRLDALRDYMISGKLSTATLHDLRSFVMRAMPEAVEPGLKAILEDIRIRAEVELAKMEMLGD